MRRSLTAGVIMVALVACLEGACKGNVTGAAQPTDFALSSGDRDGLPKHGAPAVENPLDTSTIAADPCSALNREQLRSFVGELNKEKSIIVDAKSPKCHWIFDETDSFFQVGDIIGGLNMEDGANGLTTIYTLHKSGNLSTFRPLRIEGYPAVVYSRVEQRDGRCVLAVGVSNKLVYVVDISTFKGHPKFNQPCDVSKKVAGYVIQNLKND